MAQIKFFRGLKERYDGAVTHKDAIYFATDSGEILVNEVSYSGVTDASYDSESKVLTIKKGDQSTTVDLNALLKFETKLPDNLTTPTKIGGLNKGTSVETLKTKTLSQILEDILFEELQPSVLNPSCSISPKGSWANNGIYEVGAAAPSSEADFNITFNRGNCTVVGQPTKYRAGTETSREVKLGSAELAEGSKITLGTMTYNLTVNHGEGDTLVTSKGNKATIDPNPLTAGSVKSSCSIFGTYPYFCNGASASNSNQDTNLPSKVTPNTKLPLQKWSDSLIGAKFASEASTEVRLEFLYPKTKNVTKVEFFNTASGKWEVFGTDKYTTSAALQLTIQGTPVDYMKLTTTGALSGALQLRFTVSDAGRVLSPTTYNGEEITEKVMRTLSMNSMSEPFVSDTPSLLAASTGNRPSGVSAFSVNFEPGGQAPLDARTLVPTKADLIAAETYSGKNYYKGMLVVVADDGGKPALYILKDISKITEGDYSGWQRVDVGGQSIIEIVNDLTTGGTNKALSAEQGKVLKQLIDSKSSLYICPGDVNTLSGSSSDAGAIQGVFGDAKNLYESIKKLKLPVVATYADSKTILFNSIAALNYIELYGEYYDYNTLKGLHITINLNVDGDPESGNTYEYTSFSLEEVTILKSSDIVNNLTSGGANKVLSAEQGKKLQESIDANKSTVESYTVNGKKINSNPTLGGADINLSEGFAEAGEYSDPAIGDSLDTAIGKLAKGVKDATQSAGVTSINGEKGAINLATGDTNGTFKVNSKEVAIAGLKSAAYADTTAFDAAGKADAVKALVIGSDGDTSDKSTIYGAKKYAEEKASAAQSAAASDAQSKADEALRQAKEYTDGKDSAQTEALNAHIGNKQNPHSVTKEQVGLGNVTNDAQVKRSEMGVASGVATLDKSGKVPASQLPSYVDDVVEAENFAALPEEGESGKIYVTLDNNKTYRWGGSSYVEISQSLALGETSSTAYAGDKGKATTDKVNAHVADESNPHNVTKAQVGLGNVDNTADADKPISTATQAALDKKVDKEDGKSLVEDTEIAKLKGLSNQSAINSAIADAKKAGTDADEHLKAVSGQTTGAYVANAESNYIKGATSLNDADKLLDAQIKKNADAIAALGGGGSGSIQDQIESAINDLKGGASGEYDTLGEIETKVKGNASEIANIKNYKVNGKAISSNPTLTGADIQLTGYSVDQGVVSATDTVNQAIGKLDDALIWHEAE